MPEPTAVKLKEVCLLPQNTLVFSANPSGFQPADFS
jgi:hypothetical protein